MYVLSWENLSWMRVSLMLHLQISYTILIFCLKFLKFLLENFLYLDHPINRIKCYLRWVWSFWVANLPSPLIWMVYDILNGRQVCADILPLMNPDWSSLTTSLMHDCNLLAIAFEKILKSELSKVIGRQFESCSLSWSFFGIRVIIPLRCSSDNLPISSECRSLSKNGSFSSVQKAN